MLLKENFVLCSHFSILIMYIREKHVYNIIYKRFRANYEKKFLQKKLKGIFVLFERNFRVIKADFCITTRFIKAFLEYYLEAFFKGFIETFI